jgi:glycyl-tRNA synthetase beta chain
MNREALLEIGSEELPASFIALGMRQLKALAEESLKTSGLTFTSIDTYGTPRRLAVAIHGLPPGSPDQKKVVTGPPAAIAKDAQGQWTAAALGFARRQGLKPSELAIENGKVSATLHIKGVSSRHLLAELFPQWITKLEFPKAMTWEPTHFRYPRPIRWIVAMYGADLVSFSLAGVRSGRATLGIGPWAPKKILIPQAGKYAILLKNQCVLVESGSRQEAIRRYAEQAVKRSHGKVHMSAPLLEQVANLVEHPVAILGNFDPAYLDLPKEVLITCLEHHQKYFPVEQISGAKLLPHFIGIRNGMSVNQEVVREGYERVLSARLADARFFFNQDRKTSLASKVEALKGVMFQQKLGNLFDKKERVKKLLEAFAPATGAPGILDQARLAADLCKADLVTDMVREFPELQGIMARLYAIADGEDPVVAQALEEHYWPITLTGHLPSSDVAALVALADKLDTLAGDFAVGLIPTGSADPYGLRRAAVGVIRILEDKGWPLDLEILIQEAVKSQPEHVQAAAIQSEPKLKQFMKQRWSALLEERGFKFDEIDAVLSAQLGEVRATVDRLTALHALRSRQGFEPLSVAFKRGTNIVRQAALKGEMDNVRPIQRDLLKEPCEQVLFQTIESIGEQVSKNVASREYRQALESLISLREPLDGFFNGVMVMAEDPPLRANRLALIKQLVSLFDQIADFSKLQNA